jgi:5'-nucleotidase
MQPFGNGLVVKTLTGAQLKAVLEQGFREQNGKVELRAVLIPSEGFTYRYDLSRPAEQRIVAMTLNGLPIDPERRYRVTVNNFLASGGDGYTRLANGSDPFDGGPDLDALEAWLKTDPKMPSGNRIRGN